MRVPSPAFQQHASKIKGAIVEGDGELLFPPVLNLDTQIGGPLFGNTITFPQATVDQTIAGSSDLGGLGALATTDRTLFNGLAGIWLVDVTWFFSFDGTSNAGNFESLIISDPAGNGWALAQLPHITGKTNAGTRRFFVHFAYEAVAGGAGQFSVVHHRGTTIAGDSLGSHVSFFFQKVAG